MVLLSFMVLLGTIHKEKGISSLIQIFLGINKLILGPPK